jgi:protocatechuate 3,4-dioxygenase beta subunit
MHHDDDHTSTLDGGHRAAPAGEGGVTRRVALGAAGGTGVALLLAGVRASPTGRLLDGLGPDVAEAAAGTCVMTPAKTVGPYFVDERLNRSDVRANTSDGALQSGVPLTLRLQVFDADNGCAPVQGATVDIWHANAAGLYSDEAANGTSGQNWLRGYQTTDANGLATFTTIYPGWYRGRAVHVHFKVRVYNGTTETLEFTSQLFFTDDMNNSVFSTYSPYKDRTPKLPDTSDGADNIYGSDGSSLLLSPAANGSGGYTADFSIGISRTTSQLGNTSAGPGGSGPAGSGTTTTGDTAVGVALKGATMVRTARGTRQLRLKLQATETVTVKARLTRGGKNVAHRTARIRSGTHYVRVSIASAVHSGAARLQIPVTDANANKKTYARTVHVHARR